MSRVNIQQIKDTHEGETCVVAGLGYSVSLFRETQLFSDDYVVSVNNADAELKDIDMIYDMEVRPKVDWKHPGVEWVTLDTVNTDEADYYVQLYKENDKFDFESNEITGCHSSIIGAAWLAIYMGFSRVLLVGADFCKGPEGQRYFWDRTDHLKLPWYTMSEDKTDNNASDNNVMRTRTIKCLESLAKYGNDNGCTFANLSPYIQFENMLVVTQ